jgi:regulator of sirC expression with transglutaminase-like and TPR domain
MQSALFQRLEEILQRHFMVEADLLRANRYLEDLGLTQPEKKELFNLFKPSFQA